MDVSHFFPHDFSMRDFKVNSELLPSGFLREFDAHIYYDEKNQEEVSQLRMKLIESFKTPEVFIGPMINRPIGPHPQAMFEVNFSVDQFSDVVLWLMQEHGNISILIHRLTGNDYIDHTREALWLGQTLPLDFSKFSIG